MNDLYLVVDFVFDVLVDLVALINSHWLLQVFVSIFIVSRISAVLLRSAERRDDAIEKQKSKDKSK